MADILADMPKGLGDGALRPYLDTQKSILSLMEGKTPSQQAELRPMAEARLQAIVVADAQAQKAARLVSQRTRTPLDDARVGAVYGEVFRNTEHQLIHAAQLRLDGAYRQAVSGTSLVFKETPAQKFLKELDGESQGSWLDGIIDTKKWRREGLFAGIKLPGLLGGLGLAFGAASTFASGLSWPWYIATMAITMIGGAAGGNMLAGYFSPKEEQKLPGGGNWVATPTQPEEKKAEEKKAEPKTTLDFNNPYPFDSTYLLSHIDLGTITAKVDGREVQCNVFGKFISYPPDADAQDYIKQAVLVTRNDENKQFYHVFAAGQRSVNDTYIDVSSITPDKILDHVRQQINGKTLTIEAPEKTSSLNRQDDPLRVATERFRNGGGRAEAPASPLAGDFNPNANLPNLGAGAAITPV